MLMVTVYYQSRVSAYGLFVFIICHATCLSQCRVAWTAAAAYTFEGPLEITFSWNFHLLTVPFLCSSVTSLQIPPPPSRNLRPQPPVNSVLVVFFNIDFHFFPGAELPTFLWRPRWYGKLFFNFAHHISCPKLFFVLFLFKVYGMKRKGATFYLPVCAAMYVQHFFFSPIVKCQM